MDGIILPADELGALMKSKSLLLITIPVLGLVCVAQATEGEFESVPVTLAAADIVPDNLLKGEHHTVRGEVENDGYMNHYTIESPFGEFTASSDLQLAIRVQEIHAIAELKEVSRTEAYAESLQKAVTSPLYSAMNVITNPVETVKMVPGSVAQLFKRSTRRIRDTADSVSEEVEDLSSDDEDGESSSTSDTVDKGVEAATELGLKEVGYTRARREWARRLGVDPYTTNEILNEELDRVSWASAIGRFSTRFAPIPRLDVLDYLGEAEDLVWSMDPLDLRMRNEEELRKVGIEEEKIAALYENGNMRPVLMTGLVESVVALGEVESREAIIDLAIAAETYELAAFQVRNAGYLARLNGDDRIASIIPGDIVATAVLKDGRVIAPIALNYLVWTESFESAVDQGVAMIRTRASGEIEIHLEGGASEVAKQNLEELGFKVRTRAFTNVVTGE